MGNDLMVAYSAGIRHCFFKTPFPDKQAVCLCQDVNCSADQNLHSICSGSKRIGLEYCNIPSGSHQARMIYKCASKSTIKHKGHIKKQG